MSLSAWLFDLQSAWRGLRSGRWASETAVVALAVGLGASVSATMVAYADLVRPLPFSRATELVTLGKTYAILAIAWEAATFRAAARPAPTRRSCCDRSDRCAVWLSS